MSVKVAKSAAAPTSDIAAIEAFLGSELPSGFKGFLSEYDGAKPPTNIFPIDSANDSGVNRFIPSRRFLLEREKIEGLPDRAFPIAWAEGGNYVLIDIDAGEAVLFWDHETAQLTKRRTKNWC